MSASAFGLPVSTMHVSVESIAGVGACKCRFVELAYPAPDFSVVGSHATHGRSRGLVHNDADKRMIAGAKTGLILRDSVRLRTD